jgi:hypothetical protein
MDAADAAQSSDSIMRGTPARRPGTMHVYLLEGLLAAGR